MKLSVAFDTDNGENLNKDHMSIAKIFISAGFVGQRGACGARRYMKDS